jgi:two-component system phosphate regulon sensor histidine kinase PhoR
MDQRSAQDRDLPFDANILDGLPDPVILLDRERRVVDCNRAAHDLLGSEAVGQDLALSLDSPPVIENVAAVIRGESSERAEIFIPFPVSRSYDLDVWELPARRRGRPPWIMVVLHDATATKRAEQMRADFVSNVSHELRSPLSSVLGFIETLRGPARDDPEATDRFLEIMEAEAKRMTRLINDLLTLSKVESDEHIRPEGTVDLRELMTQVANILSVRAQERGMEIVPEIAEDTPRVVGDADELTQVFQNLVANAISYGNEGTAVRVVVRPVEAVPGTGAAGLSVAVINRGEAIPPEDISRLTERFYRVDKGRSRSMGGTGLGLAIGKHIGARHRGHLGIESVAGGETTFTVDLPRVREAGPPAGPS